jgi:hypothetical protein
MATYKVEKRDNSYYVVGLREEFGDDPDTMLLYRYSYPYSETPDIDTRMKDAHMMFGALYDLYQCHDGIKKGDIFETEFGNFVAEGVHIIPQFDLGPDPREPTPIHDSSVPPSIG